MLRCLHLSLLVLPLALLGCSKSAAIDTTTPVVQPEPEPMPEPAVEEEPEEAPVVAEPPRNLDIQRNVIRLKPGIRILFATDSDQLLPESFEILDEVASVMEQNQRIRIRVEGHTDDVGRDKDNLDLSTRRSASVRAYLIGKGVAEERLESHGCGEGTPIADNKTDDGRQQNRRVEFVILRRRRAIEPCQIYKPRERRGGEAAAAATP